AADSAYGSAEMLGWLVNERAIEPHIPVFDKSARDDGTFSRGDFSEFIEEASKLFTDALTHQFDDPSKFVRLYALVGKLRLCAPSNVIAKAEEVMQHIVEVYHLPTEISAIRKTGSGTTSMCFGRSAKLVAKTWAFR